MQLVRTTVRLDKRLIKSAKAKALEEDKSLQEIMNRALEKYLDEKAQRKAKTINFITHDLGAPLDNLTRDDYYPDIK